MEKKCEHCSISGDMRRYNDRTKDKRCFGICSFLPPYARENW